MQLISTLTISMTTLIQIDAPKRVLSGFKLEKTVKLMKLSFSRILLMHPEIDVTVDQWVILHFLYLHKTLSQQELGDLALKDAPTITRMLDLMEAKGLVSRKADKEDKRKFKIMITSEGKENHNKIQPLVDAFRSEAYAGLSDDQLNTLEIALDTIFTNLSKSN